MLGLQPWPLGQHFPGRLNSPEGTEISRVAMIRLILSWPTSRHVPAPNPSVTITPTLVMAVRVVSVWVRRKRGQIFSVPASHQFLQRFLESLRWRESHCLACLDLNGLARSLISLFAGRPLCDLYTGIEFHVGLFQMELHPVVCRPAPSVPSPLLKNHS